MSLFFSFFVLNKLMRTKKFQLVEEEVEKLLEVRETRETEEGSGWTVDRTHHIDLCYVINKEYRYGQDVDLSTVTNSSCLLNIRSTESDCFLTAVIFFAFREKLEEKYLSKFTDSELKYGVRPEKISDLTRADRFTFRRDLTNPSLYEPYKKHFITHGIDFPITMQGIRQFVDQNKDKKLRVIIFSEDGADLRPIFDYGDKTKEATFVHLYSVTGVDEGENFLSHFLVICNLESFLRENYGSSKANTKMCYNCHHSFRSIDKLTDHQKLCFNNQPVNARLPSEDKKNLSYQSSKYEYKTPLFIIADFETLTHVNEEKKVCPAGCPTVCDHLSTVKEREMITSAFAYYAIDQDSNIVASDTYIGKDFF